MLIYYTRQNKNKVIEESGQALNAIVTDAEWQDIKEYRLNMDQVIKLKDRQISTLEYELKEKFNNNQQH
jgi:hypothetical protein